MAFYNLKKKPALTTKEGEKETTEFLVKELKN
jgi:hypothetical protein